MKEHVALTRCYFCGEGSTILLAKTYRRAGNDMEPVKDLKPFHDKVLDMEPCSKCKGYMKQGIILITIDESKCDKDWNKDPDKGKCRDCGGGKSQRQSFGSCKMCGGTGHSHFIPNPYRAGGFFVVTEDAIKRMLAKQKDMLEWCLKHRWMFMDHEAAKYVGLIKASEDKELDQLKERMQKLKS